MPEKRSRAGDIKIHDCIVVCSSQSTLFTRIIIIKEREKSDYVESFSLCLHFVCRFVSFGTDTVLESFAQLTN